MAATRTIPKVEVFKLGDYGPGSGYDHQSVADIMIENHKRIVESGQQVPFVKPCHLCKSCKGRGHKDGEVCETCFGVGEITTSLGRFGTEITQEGDTLFADLVGVPEQFADEIVSQLRYPSVDIMRTPSQFDFQGLIDGPTIKSISWDGSEHSRIKDLRLPEVMFSDTYMDGGREVVVLGRRSEMNKPPDPKKLDRLQDEPPPEPTPAPPPEEPPAEEPPAEDSSEKVKAVIETIEEFSVDELTEVLKWIEAKINNLLNVSMGDVSVETGVDGMSDELRLHMAEHQPEMLRLFQGMERKISEQGTEIQVTKAESNCVKLDAFNDKMCKLPGVTPASHDAIREHSGVLATGVDRFSDGAGPIKSFAAVLKSLPRVSRGGKTTRPQSVADVDQLSDEVLDARWEEFKNDPNEPQRKHLGDGAKAEFFRMEREGA